MKDHAIVTLIVDPWKSVSDRILTRSSANAEGPSNVL